MKKFKNWVVKSNQYYNDHSLLGLLFIAFYLIFLQISIPLFLFVAVLFVVWRMLGTYYEQKDGKKKESN